MRSVSTTSRTPQTWQQGDPWTVTDAAELYEVARWGQGYFSVGANGHVLAHATKEPGRSIDLKQLVDHLQLRGIGLPILIRFRDILRHRLGDIYSAFQAAINQHQYNGIAVKTVTSTYPQVLWVNMTYPDIEMYVYPVPTKVLEFHVVSVNELTQPVNLATDLAFPPGYLRCFRYNLACELAPEFGTEPSRQVQRIAMTSKRNLKRINNPDDIMALPYSIVATRQRFNIFAGNY